MSASSIKNKIDTAKFYTKLVKVKIKNFQFTESQKKGPHYMQAGFEKKIVKAGIKHAVCK